MTNSILCPKCGHDIDEHLSYRLAIELDADGYLDCSWAPSDIAKELLDDARMEVRPGCPQHDLSGYYLNGAEEEPCICPVPRSLFESAISRMSKVSMHNRLLQEQLDALERRFPCDGCHGDFPEEDCPRHGRTPQDLWRLLSELYEDNARLDAELRSLSSEESGDE